MVAQSLMIYEVGQFMQERQLRSLGIISHTDGECAGER